MIDHQIDSSNQKLKTRAVDIFKNFLCLIAACMLLGMVLLLIQTVKKTTISLLLLS